MKRTVLMVAALGFVLGSGSIAQASWSSLHYSGYQPWWNLFAKRYKGLTPEEERLQKFWHDYYDSMANFYRALDKIDWVAYYKNHGYQINAGCGFPGAGNGRINYAPVFVSPMLQWAVPHAPAGGPPGPMMGGPMGGPMMGGPMMGGPMMGGPMGGPMPGPMPGPGF